MESTTPRNVPVATRIATHLRSNVIGLVAVFIALSGSAYAAGLADNSVKSRHIVNDQVRSVDVRDDSLAGGGLTGADIVESSLSGVPVGANAVGSSQVQDNSLGAADLGSDSVQSSEIATNAVGKPEIAANTVGSEELLAINEVANTRTIPAGFRESVAATCPAGQQIITGGYSAAFHPPQRSHRTVSGGWEILVENTSGRAYDYTVYAYCLAP